RRSRKAVAIPIRPGDLPPMPAGLLSDEGSSTTRRILAAYVLLLAANIAAWGWAFAAFRHYPLLLGTSLLAYGFGVRHAIDADHIAAIDNVTRKLMQEGKRPLMVGFFFSLGHSTVVILATLAIAATAQALTGPLQVFQQAGRT